jgi:hypothetical protein
VAQAERGKAEEVTERQKERSPDDSGRNFCFEKFFIINLLIAGKNNNHVIRADNKFRNENGPEGLGLKFRQNIVHPLLHILEKFMMVESAVEIFPQSVPDERFRQSTQKDKAKRDPYIQSPEMRQNSCRNQSKFALE